MQIGGERWYCSKRDAGRCPCETYDQGWLKPKIGFARTCGCVGYPQSVVFPLSTSGSCTRSGRQETCTAEKAPHPKVGWRSHVLSCVGGQTARERGHSQRDHGARRHADRVATMAASQESKLAWRLRLNAKSGLRQPRYTGGCRFFLVPGAGQPQENAQENRKALKGQ